MRVNVWVPMTNDELTPDQELRPLLDKAAIREVTIGYCRGVERRCGNQLRFHVTESRDESGGVRRSYGRTRYRGGLLMRSVTYSMGVSLDGYIVGPDGGFGWTAPDEEVFRFVTDEIRHVGVHLLGRRIYETMLYWETADQDPSLDDAMLEWTALWKPLPKVVFSTTLTAVQGNARLAAGGLAEEIERLRAEPAGGEIAIGGATLAAEAAALGLVDEYRARVYPVLVGGGIPFFPRRERQVDLELVETRTFSSRVVYLRDRVAR
jgi:dihydrofolate reductase